MIPVQGGTQKITFNQADDREYEAKKRAAQQAVSNPYVAGIQDVLQRGVGDVIKGSRTSYGNVNIMPQQIEEGANSNFQQVDTPGNAPLDDPMNQTGAVDTQVSATTNPQEDPNQFEDEALTRRLELMRRGGQHTGLNNRSQVIRG